MLAFERFRAKAHTRPSDAVQRAAWMRIGIPRSARRRLCLPTVWDLAHPLPPESAQVEIRRGSVSRHAVVRTVELSNGHDRRVLRMNAGSSV